VAVIYMKTINSP